MQARPLKALSSEGLADLREGRGMGLALAGELNGYPGPKHVLELAGELNLTDAQHARTQQLFDTMKAEAVPLGQQLIAAEIDLDRQFSGRAITPASLTAATAAIGAAQGTLRATHLYHLAMMEVVTPEQIRRYGELRGYGAAAPAGHCPACTITRSETQRGSARGLLPGQRLQAFRQVDVGVGSRLDADVTAAGRRMVPCRNDDGLGRLLAHHADRLCHLRHVAGVALREVAAEVIGVEVGRRGLRATGQNDHNQGKPKSIHRATDTAQILQIWIARCGEVALNCPQTGAP